METNAATPVTTGAHRIGMPIIEPSGDRALNETQPMEAFVTSIIESSCDAIISKTPQGIITSWNPAAHLMFGYTAAEIIGKPATLLLSPDRPRELDEILARIREGERIEHYETYRRHKNGNNIHISLTVSPIRDSSGRLIGASSIARDITDRKVAQEKLVASSKYARSLIEASVDPLVTISAEGKITDVNEATVKVTGVSRDELIGTDFSDYFTEPGKARQGYRQVFAKGVVTDYPLTIRHHAGRLTHVLYNASVYRDVNGNVLGVFAAARDVTAQKKAERKIAEQHAKEKQRTVELEVRVEERTAELNQLVKRLQEEIAQKMQAMEELREKDRMMMQQSRLAAMGEMMNNIAHQWRQPLNTIGLLIQQMQIFHEAGLFTEELLQNCTGDAMTYLTHMSQTIDDFMSFFHPNKEKENFDVNQAIRQTVSLVERSFTAQSIAIQISNEPDLFIHGHRNEYSQVLLNIIMNARDAFTRFQSDNRLILIRSFTANKKLVVTVTDNAGGIEETIIDRIFDPYFTTKEPGKGTGIGLYMAKNIIETNMNGSLTVRNAGEGAEFRIEV